MKISILAMLLSVSSAQAAAPIHMNCVEHGGDPSSLLNLEVLETGRKADRIVGIARIYVTQDGHLTYEVQQYDVELTPSFGSTRVQGDGLILQIPYFPLFDQENVLRAQFLGHNIRKSLSCD
ncbi:MAG: hypothetical protein ACXWPM_08385 [Bdellovibrionota bacterium]